MLTLKNVSRTFANGETGFENISFTIQPGEIIGVLGPSGCGKSTLLRVISGLDPDYTGDIIVGGSKLEGINDKAGFIFQEPRLMPWLTVRENVAFGIKGDKREKIAKAEKFIELVGLKGFENHYPKELSGGMAQRVAIARALVVSPEILLLDEPFSALDAFTKMQLQDLLLEIWQKTKSTMLLVTHDIDEALYLCDRLFILRGRPGKVVHVLNIDKPRPRSRGDGQLASMKEEIISFLSLVRHQAWT